MDFSFTDRQSSFRARVREFMELRVRVRDRELRSELVAGDRWQPLQVIEELKGEEKEAGLWNLFMPPPPRGIAEDNVFEFTGERLTNLEYALCAEEMGRIAWASEVFNCSAPDTGNMEVLYRYGTLEQKQRWLKPLMDGEVRSAFLMTEPNVASSDATNIETSIQRDGGEYVINGANGGRQVLAIRGVRSRS